MEQFMEGLARNSMVAYGREEILRLSSTGAIDKKFYFLLLKTKYSTNTDTTTATIAPTYSSVR